MKTRHRKAQAFLASLAGNCPELPFEPTLLPELFASTAGSTLKSVSMVSNLVEKSQGLAARVLRVANSAYYGMQTAVSSLPHAVRLLGLQEVRNIILQIGVLSVMRRLTLPKSFPFDELWEHQVRTAGIARCIAFSMPGASDPAASVVSPDELYAAGLLHDLGKTMLAANCPEDWVLIQDLAESEKLPFHQAEDKYWSIDHAIAGARLLTFWGLPSKLVELVNWHHAPDMASKQYIKPSQVLAAANLLAHQPQESFVDETGAGLTIPQSLIPSLPSGVDQAKLLVLLVKSSHLEPTPAMLEALEK